MIFTKLGVSQKQASSQASAAAASARQAWNSGSPHAASRSRRQEMARANAATQLQIGSQPKTAQQPGERGGSRRAPGLEFGLSPCGQQEQEAGDGEGERRHPVAQRNGGQQHRRQQNRSEEHT